MALPNEWTSVRVCNTHLVASDTISAYVSSNPLSRSCTGCWLSSPSTSNEALAAALCCCEILIAVSSEDAGMRVSDVATDVCGMITCEYCLSSEACGATTLTADDVGLVAGRCALTPMSDAGLRRRDGTPLNTHSDERRTFCQLARRIIAGSIGI